MKHINKIPLRKLIHKKEMYLWKRGHYHLKDYSLSECAEKVVIYLEGFKNAPLHLHFREEDNLLITPYGKQKKWQVGYPESGVIWCSSKENKTITETAQNYLEVNLNHPKVIVKFIDYFLENGWYPKTDKQVFKIEHALSKINEFNLY